MAETCPNILVIGAAGRYTGLALPLLRDRGANVCGLVRSIEKGEKILARGASEYSVGDLRNEASLAIALRDIDAVYYIAPVYPGDESQRVGKALVDLARDAGVKKFVFSSVLNPMLTALDNHIQKVPVEEAIINSGMDFTILRPCHLYQNMVGKWPLIVEKGVFAEPYSASRRLSHVDYRDVAEAAVIGLLDDRLRNGCFDLCADGGVDRHEIAAIMSKVLGKPVRAETADMGAWLAGLPLPDDGYTRDALARMYAYYDQHGLVGNPLVLKAILGREPRSLEQFFGDLLAGRPVTAYP